MRLHVTRFDGWLLLMTIIWGSNYTVVKIGIRQFPELAFNSLRLLVAAAVFLALMPLDPARRGGPAWPRLTPAEWARVAALGILGHLVYQLLFLGAVARTTISTTSLVFACAPIVVAMMSAAFGQEQVPLSRWIGAALSLAGIALILDRAGASAGDSRAGDLMAVGAMLCWALYTAGSKPLLRRLSAMVVTGYSMTIGSVLYLPVAARSLAATRWETIGWDAWAALVASAVLSLGLGYVIWYTAVQRFGTTRTSVYNNVTPIVAMIVAAITLGEPITALKVCGAAAVLAGVALTRIDITAPPEE